MEAQVSEDATQEFADDVDLDRIYQVIPHRPPFLFIEKLVDIVPGESAVGIKTVSSNEDFFRGHFPIKAVMPGVLMVEALAQTAAALVMHTLDWTPEEQKNKVVYFMSIDNCRFRRPVFPGSVLYNEVRKVQNRGMVWRFEGKSRVDGIVVTEARFAAMIADIR